MQTVRDAVVLLVLILLIASVRISPRPEVEVLLRRLYKLAGNCGRYAEILPLLKRWAVYGEGAPAWSSPALASLASFYAGAMTLATSGDFEQARELFQPLGFLESWWIIGPFDNERGTGFEILFERLVPTNDELPYWILSQKPS